MARKDQRRAFLGFLVRMPGALIVAIWLALFLASFGVAALVDWAEYQDTIVGRAQRRVEQLERRPYRPDNPFAHQDDPYTAAADSVFGLDDLLGPDSNRAVPSAEFDPRLRGLAEELIGGADNASASYRERFGDSPPTSALDSARNNLEQAALAQQTVLAGLLGAGLGWLLAFVFVTVGTARWVTARDGWVRVQSWHGGKLLMLYLPFTAAAVLYAFAGTIPVDDDAFATAGVLFVASALLLLACGAMLVRATWNWLTGREGKRRVESTPGNHISLRSRFVTPLLQLMRRPRAAAAMWLILGLLIGAIAATFALQPRTYADCILRGMKYTPTATATRALQQACGQKFGSVTQQTSGVAAPRRPRAPQAPRR